MLPANRRKSPIAKSVHILVMSNLCSCLFVLSCIVFCVHGQVNNVPRPGPSVATTAANVGPTASGPTGSEAASDDPDYSDADYDDKDVQFDQSPPNVLILLADPENGTTTPLANQPNTEVILDPSLKKIHLFCSAYYPIKWVYSGQGVSKALYKTVTILVPCHLVIWSVLFQYHGHGQILDISSTRKLITVCGQLN